MSAVLRYSMMRFALFVLVLAVLSAAGASTLVAVGGAALVSMLLAYVLLRGPREAAARVVAERTAARIGARRSGVDDDADVEDRAVDAAPDQQPGRADRVRRVEPDGPAEPSR